MDNGMVEETRGGIDRGEEPAETLDGLTWQLAAKRSELALLQARMEEAVRARDELMAEPVAHGGSDVTLLPAGIGAPCRSMLYAEASLAQLKLLTVQNQVAQLEWSLRQMERRAGAVR